MKNINVVNDEWKTNLYIKPKLSTYVLFKDTAQQLAYLRKIIVQKIM